MAPRFSRALAAALFLLTAACTGTAIAGDPPATTTSEGTTTSLETRGTTTTTVPVPTAVALTEGMPRVSTYSFLDVAVTEAVLGNIEPRTYLREQEVGDETYLFLTVEATNRSDTDVANWPPTPFSLLVDGEEVQAAEFLEGRPHLGLTSLNSTDVVLAFPVPDGTGFDSLTLVLAETGRIPMFLPMVGEIPDSSYEYELPLRLSGPAQGEGVGCRQSLEVDLNGASISIDLLDTEKYPSGYGSRRAALGDAFLTVEMRVHNNGGSICGAGATNFGNSDVRLVIDGSPREPITFVNTSIGVNADEDFSFHFAYPVASEELILLVGSEDATPLYADIDISQAPPYPADS